MHVYKYLMHADLNLQHACSIYKIKFQIRQKQNDKKMSAIFMYIHIARFIYLYID